MLYVIYDISEKNSPVEVDRIVTNHSISLDEAINLLDWQKLEKSDPWDPDFSVAGQDVWYDDLTLELINDDAELLKYKVVFSAGESRGIVRDGRIMPCDFMLCNVPDPSDPDETIELYAEIIADPENEGCVYDELINYWPLKLEILKQAAANGIDPALLDFPPVYDPYTETVENPFGPYNYVVEGSDPVTVRKAADQFASSLDFYSRIPYSVTSEHIIDARQTVEKKYSVNIRPDLP